MALDRAGRLDHPPQLEARDLPAPLVLRSWRSVPDRALRLRHLEAQPGQQNLLLLQPLGYLHGEDPSLLTLPRRRRRRPAGPSGAASAPSGLHQPSVCLQGVPVRVRGHGDRYPTSASPRPPTRAHTPRGRLAAARDLSGVRVRRAGPAGQRFHRPRPSPAQGRVRGPGLVQALLELDQVTREGKGVSHTPNHASVRYMEEGAARRLRIRSLSRAIETSPNVTEL